MSPDCSLQESCSTNSVGAPCALVTRMACTACWRHASHDKRSRPSATPSIGTSPPAASACAAACLTPATQKVTELSRSRPTALKGSRDRGTWPAMYAEQGEYRTGSEQDGPRRTGVGDHQGAASALGGCPSTSRARARCCARLQLCAQRLGGREPGGVRAIALAAGALQAQARHGVHQRAALLKRGELPEDGCDHLGRIAQQPCTRTSPVLLKPWSIMRVRIEAFSAYASERSAHMPVATFSIESVACPPVVFSVHNTHPQRPTPARMGNGERAGPDRAAQSVARVV